MKLYNFIRLITKYAVNFELITSGTGKYVGGQWVEGEKTITNLSGAIIPMPENKIYQSGGSLTNKDRQLYVIKPIDAALKNCKIRYKGNEYSIEQSTDYSDYADVNVYTLKWVSAFD